MEIKLKDKRFIAQIVGVAVWAILLNASMFYWQEPITEPTFCQDHFKGEVKNRCAKGVTLILWGTLLVPAFLGLTTYSIMLKKYNNEVKI